MGYFTLIKDPNHLHWLRLTPINLKNHSIIFFQKKIILNLIT